MTDASPAPTEGLHIRQDKVTREWVIYAPGRGARPRDRPEEEAARPSLPARDPGCPFCPGNEEHLSRVILELPGSGAEAPWGTRVIPNKYPAVVPGESRERRRDGIYVAMPGYGSHEVVIESPVHSRQPARMSDAELDRVVETYHRRYVDLMREHDSMMVTIFRNHGEKAGTSLLHPHSQIIVTGMVPNHLRRREEEAQHYYDQWGRCVYCDILAHEARDGTRVVFGNDAFLAFVPYAAEVPCEVWIVPRRHRADFGSVSDREKGDLARALGEVLRRLHDRLDDPDYNYVLNTSPRFKAGEPQLHWYLQIRPRLTTRAGFEIGSGISINPSLPEDDAALLRG